MSKQREAAIKNSMEKLNISYAEAAELYEFDNDGSIEHTAVNEIQMKVEDNKREKKGSSLDKVKYMKAKKKIDESKENIIATLFKAAIDSGVVLLPQEMTATKLSFMDELGSFYTMTITKHRSQPDGYNPLKPPAENA